MAVTLNGMLDRLEAARLKQRAFVADAAHELRSPLASLHTQIEVAERIGDGGELATDLLPEVRRLGVLVEDLLLLARSGDDAAPLAVHPVDVGALLAQVVARYADARVPVELTVSPGVSALAAPAALDRVCTNLVDNAVRHARTRVTVLASFTTAGAAVRIEVRDDGSGVPEADRERVFDRFTRLDEARDRDRGGSGLGLAIARALLDRQGGTITLADAGPGLLARVELPRRPDTDR